MLSWNLVIARSDSYVDHRGHNVDSLERIVSRWDAVSIENATEEELISLCLNWKELMQGYKQINSVKNRYYSQRVLELGQRMGWQLTIFDGAKDLGEMYWAMEKYDSASYYYGIALNAIEKMKIVPEEEVVIGQNYSQREKDNMVSSLYGALGNLYSMQDSIETAMSYYGKALEIFKQYDWFNSCAVCYYNMGETLRMEGDAKQAKAYFRESLYYAKTANDSLWIAGAYKGFGAMYMDLGKMRRALRSLAEADKYYSIHEDEELFSRMETLDYMGQVLKIQKRNLVVWLVVSFIALLLALALMAIYHRLQLARKEQKETSEVFEETLSEINQVAQPALQTKLNDREIAILKYLSEGCTTPQIADKLYLSAETIKWYRKKLLFKFDATSSAELVKKAIDLGILKSGSEIN